MRFYLQLSCHAKADDLVIYIVRATGFQPKQSIEHGAYLDGGEEKILMPKKFIPENARPGDTVSVFVYLDQDNRLVATTEQALAEVGQFAYLKVAWVNQYGAFLSWGLTKDLFVPFKEQNKKMEKDRSYLVYIYIDDMTKRIVASAKLDKFVEVSCDKYNIGDSVKVIVWKQTELGYKVIVDNTYAGLLYKNEIFQQLHIGEQLDAVIKSVRPDGRLDVALQRDGKFHVDESSEKILAALREAGGFLPYGDKTSPEEIYRQFGISKKTFKKSVGALYKKQLLSIEEKGIKLL